MRPHWKQHSDNLSYFRLIHTSFLSLLVRNILENSGELISILTRTRAKRCQSSLGTSVKSTSTTEPALPATSFTFSLLYHAGGNPCTWIQNVELKKSISVHARSGFQILRTRCAPWIVQGRQLNERNLSASCLNVIRNTFQSTFLTEIFCKGFHAFMIMSRRTGAWKLRWDMILPMSKSFGVSRLGLDIWRVIRLSTQLTFWVWRVISSIDGMGSSLETIRRKYKDWNMSMWEGEKLELEEFLCEKENTMD